MTIFFNREGTDQQVCWLKPILWKDTPLARYPQSWLSWVLPLHQGRGESPLVPQQGSLTPSFLLFCLFHRHIVDLQCCHRCAAKWLIYVYVYYISIYLSLYIYLLPGGVSGKESTFQCRRHETWVQSLSQEDPLEKGMATHPSILAWRIHGQRSLASYSSWGRTGSDVTEAT